MKRSPIGRFGRRARREQEDLAEFKLLVRTASLVTVYQQNTRTLLYRCARCKQHVEHVDCHHLVSKARGGSNDAGNGVALCRPCHSACHDHTADDWEHWIRSKHQRIHPPSWWREPR